MAASAGSFSKSTTSAAGTRRARHSPAVPTPAPTSRTRMGRRPPARRPPASPRRGRRGSPTWAAGSAAHRREKHRPSAGLWSRLLWKRRSPYDPLAEAGLVEKAARGRPALLGHRKPLLNGAQSSLHGAHVAVEDSNVDAGIAQEHLNIVEENRDRWMSPDHAWASRGPKVVVPEAETVLKDTPTPTLVNMTVSGKRPWAKSYHSKARAVRRKT